jgi:hypothetical protein
MLFLSSTGQLQHVATPAEQPTRAAFIDEVISHGREALNEQTRCSSYAGRFAGGERDLGFLIQAGKYWKTTRDTLHLKALNDAFGQRISAPQDIVSPVGLYILNRFITDYHHPLTQYFVHHLDAFKARFPAKDLRETGEAVLYHSIYGSSGNQLTATDIDQIQQTMIALGVEPVQAAARTFVPKLEAIMRTGQTVAAVDWVTTYCRAVPTLEAGYYAYFMHFFNQRATDQTYLEQMPKWAEAGLRQIAAGKPNPDIEASIQYELAIARQRSGQRQEALRLAERAYSLAQSAKKAPAGLEPYRQLIAQLREK